MKWFFIMVLAGVLSGSVQASNERTGPKDLPLPDRNKERINNLSSKVRDLSNQMAIHENDIKRLEQKVKDISNLLQENTVPFYCECSLVDDKKRRSLVERKVVSAFSKQGAEQKALKECDPNNNLQMIAICE